MKNHPFPGTIRGCCTSFLLVSWLAVIAAKEQLGRRRVRMHAAAPPFFHRHRPFATAPSFPHLLVPRGGSSTAKSENPKRQQGPWSWLVPGKKGSNSTESTSTTTTEPTSPEAGDKKKSERPTKQRRGRRRGNDDVPSPTTDEDNDKDNDKNKKEKQKKKKEKMGKRKGNKSDDSAVTSSGGTNTTTTTTAGNQTEQQQEQQQLPPGVIILGSGSATTPQQQQPSGSSSRRYYRSRPGQQQQQQQQPGTMMFPTTVPSSSSPLAESFAAILGIGFRVWFLTWLSKRFAVAEETFHPTQHFVWEHMHDRYHRDVAALGTALQVPPPGMRGSRWKRIQRRRFGRKPRDVSANNRDLFGRTVVVVEVQADKGGQLDVEFLSGVVTFLLQQHAAHAFGTVKQQKHKKGGNSNTTNTTTSGAGSTPASAAPAAGPVELEVCLCITSPGGSVTTYGLAAAQVQRLSSVPGIVTTALVDRIAASGGYMMASQCHKIYAAPFSTVGSIGVIAEVLNFNELVTNYGVKPIQIKSGNHKNPISTFGPVTAEEIKEEKERIAAVHKAFKEWIVQHRPGLVNSMDKIATGTVFLGTEAAELKLIDGVMVAEDYLLERIVAGDRVLRLHRSTQQSRFGRRLPGLSPADILPHMLWNRCGGRWLHRQVVDWLNINNNSNHHASAISGGEEEESPLQLARLLQWLVPVASVLTLVQEAYSKHHSGGEP